MRIDHLRAENFRCFESLDLSLHPECTVIAGVNGSGKSSVLDALSVAMGAWFLGFPALPSRGIAINEVRRVASGMARTVELDLCFPAVVRARGRVQDQDVEWSRELTSARGRTTRVGATALAEMAASERMRRSWNDPGVLPVLVSLGTGRLWIQKRSSEPKSKSLDAEVSGYEDALDPASNQTLLLEWMKRRELARLQDLARASGRPGQSKNPFTFAGEEPGSDVMLSTVEQVAATCVPGAKALFYDVAHSELRVEYESRIQSFSLLPDGVRNLVALTADIAWRCARLNPHLGTVAPQQTSGIVLIDEIELHLHPAWQRSVLGGLRKAFPKVQFVVTTHSPQVIASVPADCVRFLDADGFVTRPSIGEGADTNTILRDLMGVPVRPPEFEAAIEVAEKAIESRRFDDARAVLASLASRWGEDDPTITGLRWELADAEAMPDA